MILQKCTSLYNACLWISRLAKNYFLRLNNAYWGWSYTISIYISVDSRRVTCNIVYPCLLLFKEGEYKLIKPSAKGKLPRRHSPVNTWNISSMQWSTNDKVINEKLLYNLASIVVFFGTWCKYLYKCRTSFALKHFIKSGWTLWIDINFAT